MADMQRMTRALRAAHAAGDTEAATRLAQAIRQQRATTTPDTQEQPQDTFLADRGLAEDERATRLYTEFQEAQASGDEDAVQRAQIRLGGYLEGRDALTDEAGGESQGENMASRAETALRGAGQGAFGLGDFAASLGSWLGDGGPFNEQFSLRDHFAYQRARREGMSAQNPVTSTTGYVTGAVVGGGGLASGATRAAARAPGPIGRLAQQVFVRRPGRGGLPELGRAAAGSGTAAATATALEGGDLQEIGQSAALGAIAGPAAERVMDVGAQAVRGVMRRADPEAAATASIRRRMLENEAGVGTAGARDLNRRVAAQGDGGTILEAANPRQATQLGEEASLSPEGFDEISRQLPEMQNRRAGRVQSAVQGDDAPVSVDAVRADEQAVAETAARGARRQTAEDVRAINRQRDTDLGAMRREGEVERQVQQGAIRAAERNLQRRLVDAADTQSDLVTPQAIEAARKSYADEVMGQLGEETVVVGNAANVLQRDAVRRLLNDYASSADPVEAETIRELLNTGMDAGEVGLTVRQIDAFRRAAAAAGEANPALRRGLTDVSDELAAAAARSVPEYGNFLDTYARLSRTMEGARRGFQVRGAQVSQLTDEARLAREAEGAERSAFDVGMNRGAQRAVADEARRSPSAARRMAEQMRDEPERFEVGMGPRAPAARRVAEASLDEVEEAEAALRQLQQRQADDAAELRQLSSDRAFARSQEGQDQLQAIRDRMDARLAPIARAEQIANVGSENFIRARDAAVTEGVDEEFRRVARTALAEAAGESAEGAVTVSQRLANDPGLQRRVAAVLGPDVTDTLVRTGAREEAASEAVMGAARGSAQNLRQMSRKEREAIISAVDLGVMATDRWSGSFGANAFLRLLRQLNGDEQRAFALARALSSPDRATQRRTIARLAQLGASIEDQKAYARAAGAAAGIATGQAVAEDEEQ
jgi:hypothetical protein